MFTKVTEDGRAAGVCPVGRRIFCRAHRGFRPFGLRLGACGLMGGVCVLAAMIVAAPAAAQQPGNNQPFRAKVIDLTDQVERITVPLRGSVTVETTVQIVRADVVATEVADVQIISPTRLLITGQGYGHTSIVLIGADDRQHVFDVTVEMDLRRLNEAIREIDPLSHAEAISVVGNIVLRGQVSSADRAARVAALAELFAPPETVIQNHLDVAGEQQVLLRVVVAEVSRSASRELGINGWLAGDDFQDVFLVNQIGGLNPANIGAAADALVTSRIPFLTDTDGLPLRPETTLSLGFPRVQMQVFIRAVQDNGLLKVLAEPNLVAISGETASFLAGGEFPFLEPQSLGTVTIAWKEFGVRLNFTPNVRGDQRIRLRVRPEVSELDFVNSVQFEGLVVPGLRSRSAETTVEMGSGQTIAIAGLLNEQVRSLATRVPGLGDIPILGALFRSVDYQRDMSELVILVTPEIVAPIDAHQAFRLPTDEVDPPNDFELYALGRLEASSTGKKQQDNGEELEPIVVSQPDELSLHGPWGHAGLNGSR